MHWDTSLIVMVDGKEHRASWIVNRDTAAEAKAEALLLAQALDMQVVREAGCVEHPGYRKVRQTFAITD